VDLSALTAIQNVGLALVGVLALSYVLFKRDTEYHDDLRKSRDKAVDTAAAGASAIDRLTEKQDDRLGAIERRLDAIEQGMRR
jgi:hypothetical protein